MKNSGKRNNGYFIIRQSRIQGRGAFALVKIPKGTRIIEYVGERIGPDLELKRYNEETMERHHTFLFSVDEMTTIDAGIGGNDARFINHSCDPNCEVFDEDGRIYIFAQSTIQKGEELTYDYRFSAPGKITKALREFYVCRCGTSRCRGTILNIEPSRNGTGRRKKQLPGRHTDRHVHRRST